ncbi:MAG TPA: hypothetical protein VFF27_00035 [Bacteroidia bacterium]|jgi:hypothetical protein|nr:hypothetical protein [Bacteroidia bacterium]
MVQGEEIIVLKIRRDAFEKLYNEGLISLDGEDFELDKVCPYKEEYPENENWVKLKEEAGKAYKRLREYEYKLRAK